MVDSEDSVAVLPVVVLGTDTLLAALPATGGQLARACGAAGFAAATPATWGDEVIADATLRILTRRPEDPAILCSCPLVAEKLLNNGTDLNRFLVPVEAPPVAAARYLRAQFGSAPVHVTYAGSCPAAMHSEIDTHFTPSELFGLLAERGVKLSAQEKDPRGSPVVRRYRSLPGGAPAPQALWAQNGRMLVELATGDYSAELAQRLIARERALFDLAPRLGCVCSGVINGGAPTAARASVMATEPARSRGEVLDPGLRVEVERHIPASQRTPTPPTPPESHPAYRESFAGRDAHIRKVETVAATPPRRIARTPVAMRAVASGSLPVIRTPTGRTIPRAYLAVRPRSLTEDSLPKKAVPLGSIRGGDREVLLGATFGDSAHHRSKPPSVNVPFPVGAAYRVPGPPSLNTSRLHAATLLALVAAVVAVAVFIWA
ncbi:MAG: hypothetical protein H0W30_09135 [Gemmatimonadaceae bacterium]|nr:hypothetical protein [Gemmatimonadaceae bacterium]